MFMRITVRLEMSKRAALMQLAERERRDLRDQATILIEEGLERRGLLSPAHPQATQEVSCDER